MISAAEFAHLSLRVYEPTPTHPAGGWYRLAQKQLPSGFFAATFFKQGTGEYVVAFRGTEPDDVGDLTADLDIARKTLPRQYPEAIAFAANTVGKLKVRDFSITGHSLGGALATVVGAGTGKTTVAFNGPGMKKALAKSNLNLSRTDNIYNYRSSHDPVSGYGELVGKTFSLATGKPPKSYFWLGTPGTVYTVLKKGHFYYQQHSMANLAAAVSSHPKADNPPSRW